MANSAIFICIDACLVPLFGEISEEYFLSLRRLSQLCLSGNCGTSPLVRLISHSDIGFFDAMYRILGEPYGSCLLEGGLVIYDPKKCEAIPLPLLTPHQKTILTRTVRRRMAKLLATTSSLFAHPGMTLGFELLRKSKSNLSVTELRKVVRSRLRDLLAKGQICLNESCSSVGISLPKVHGQAIDYLAERDGISLKDSLCIGFSKRDIGFLARTRFVGCPSNADLPCKQFVLHRRGKVSLHPCARGVVDVIEHFVG